MTEIPLTDSLLHRLLEAGDAGNVAAFDDLLHPDVVVHAPFGLSSEGREAEKQVWRDAVEAMPDIRHEIRQLYDAGDTLIARVVVTGTLAGEFGGIHADGQSFQIDQALFAHIRDGKADEIWEIVDTASLLQQLSDTAK
jgi:predicted ester cyclase